ncbi:PadR family transcriptional regulator [Caulobacter sp.]|uniref:helix-turn-helix transcriptional regulator n=1 Tax=Caulobacter sp. TaxID=78 RepID=UPI0016113E30
MKRTRRPSGPALRLLHALLAAPADWRYGYDLTRETGVGAGTLYPLLERWAGQGLLVSEWRASETPGRPPRHAYRLTGAGQAYAAEWTQTVPSTDELGLAT